MLSIVSDYVLDSIDEVMEPYMHSDEHLNLQGKITEKTSALNSTLSPTQRDQLDELLNLISDANGRFTEAAYKAAFAQGVCFRDEVITK